jgi:hypothetical protein
MVKQLSLRSSGTYIYTAYKICMKAGEGGITVDSHPLLSPQQARQGAHPGLVSLLASQHVNLLF